MGSDHETRIADTYRLYGHLVHGRCRRILRDDAAADDALQETFVRLWRFPDSFAAADSKIAWLYRVADRCCFDLLDRRSTRREIRLTADEVPLVRSAAQALEDRDLVMAFLDRFEERVRQIAVLHYLDEMTQEEIAEATGWSRQTIHKKLQHLRERAAALRHAHAQGSAA